MAVASKEQKFWKRGEIVVAAIGLVGVLVTATFSNWDKLFPKQNLVQATYSGYRPTGNFETELRYYFEVTGLRQTLASTQQQLLLRAKADALSQNPDDAESITMLFDAIEKESVKLDDAIQALLPVFQKHFTLAEIQELNKFYSTEVMQSMVKKGPLIAVDAAPIQSKMMNDYYVRLRARLSETVKSE